MNAMAIITVLNVVSMNRSVSSEILYSTSKPPSYHFAAILDGNAATISDEMKLGIEDASAKENSTFEFHIIQGEETEKNIIRQCYLSGGKSDYHFVVNLIAAISAAIVAVLVLAALYLQQNLYDKLRT